MADKTSVTGNHFHIILVRSERSVHAYYLSKSGFVMQLYQHYLYLFVLVQFLEQSLWCTIMLAELQCAHGHSFEI